MTDLALKLALQENEPPLVGQILKEARLSQGLSLEEVAKTLCISKRHLVHLEEAQEDLVCDVYTLGFLKSYIQYLGLDEKNLSKMFKKQASHPPSSHLPFPAPIPGKGIPSRRILGFSFFILLAVIGGWNWVKYSNSQTYSTKNVGAVNVLPTPNTIAQGSVALQNPSPASEDLLKGDSQTNFPNNEEVESNPNTVVQEPVILQNPSLTTENPLKGDSQTHSANNEEVESKPNTIDQKPVILQNPPPLSETLPNPPLSGKMNDLSKQSTSDPQTPVSPPPVLLKTTEEVWIEVRDNKGNIILSRVFKTGESYEFKNPQHLVLTTKDASKTHLTSGGKMFTFPGNPWGVKSNIPLDPQKWVEQNPETH
jgi:cytoskeleton protein RodZ